MPIKGKLAIVTGAGRGIGKAIALAFAREGANLVLAARTNSEVEDVAGEAHELGAKALPLATDVTSWRDIKKMVKRSIEEFGRIDVLVNNAGLMMWSFGTGRDMRSVRSVPIEHWDRMMKVNLRGMFLCSRAVLDAMIPQMGGSIINISSNSGKKGKAKSVPYCTSKFGVEGFTQALGDELREYNIAVNSLYPGGGCLTSQGRLRSLVQGRKYLKPEVLVPAAIFLAEQDSSGVTAQSINALEWNQAHGLGGREAWTVTV